MISGDGQFSVASNLRRNTKEVEVNDDANVRFHGTS
jgi:hypothetical protein